ncbi:MAG: hypothetical protein A2W35_09795 [Chloroflexi bacterium RBG_16_57_11]|nr:MAG: hypothetical protein A2W35_09795 [Chloroflexi bacterium RBG_16_57_11]
MPCAPTTFLNNKKNSRPLWGGSNYLARAVPPSFAPLEEHLGRPITGSAVHPTARSARFGIMLAGGIRLLVLEGDFQSLISSPWRVLDRLLIPVIALKKRSIEWAE